MSAKRKVLVILIDQLRADCVEGALAAHVDLPNIAAFRGDAVTFTRHFSVSNPCGPSRACILTGMYAMNHRSVRNGTPLADHLPNIAREMRKSGYDPLLFGYTDTSLDPRRHHPNDPKISHYEEVLPGFREITEMHMEESYPWRASLKAKGYELPDFADFYNPVASAPDRPARPDDPAFYRAEDSDTAFLTDEFLRHMSVRQHQDWFALLTYIRPHPPLVAPVPYNRMYAGNDLPLPTRRPSPGQEAAVHPFLTGALLKPCMENIVSGCDGQVDSRNDTDVQMLRAIYLGLATEVDAHIGRIMAFLKDSGQYDDTLIILSADHGEMLGDHHMWGKQTIYDAAYRIPLIIRDPQNPAQHGTTVAAFTETVDLTPTVLDLTGRAAPAGMDGRSLRPFLEGRAPEHWRDCVHLELDFGEPDKSSVCQEATGATLREANLAILREERFKLVHFNGGLPPLLFDLEADPNEMHDLADDPAHATALLRLTRKLLSHRMRHADRTLADMKITAQGVVNYDAGS
jgi:arylsulfatase A-like enzyme